MQMLQSTAVKRIRGVRIAQMVDRLNKKLGVILMQVQVPGAARDFPPGVNFQCRLSYSVHTALNASTSVRMFKILYIVSHTTV